MPSGTRRGREDAALAEAALPSAGGDVAAAWYRLSSATSGEVPGRVAARPDASRGRTSRAGVGGPRRPVAAAALAVARSLAGAGTAAAANWLQIFRTEHVAPVSRTAADLVSLPDLSAYREVGLTSDPDVHEVPDVATAEAEDGLDVPEVAALPRGVSGEPWCRPAVRPAPPSCSPPSGPGKRPQPPARRCRRRLRASKGARSGCRPARA